MNSKVQKSILVLTLFSIFLSISSAEEYQVKKDKSKFTDNYYLNLGILAAESNKPDSAISYITKAIEINKKNPISYYIRATVYYELGKLDDALKDLNQSIKINSKDEKSLYLRAIIYQSKSSFLSATKDYESLIKLNSTDSNYYFQLAFCLQELNEFQKSIDNYLKYEKLTKSPAKEFFINIIYNFVQLKKYTEALNYIQKSEKAGNNSTEFIQLKINILSNNNRCEEALKILEDNLKLIENNSGVLTNIGMCFLQNKKYEEAGRALARAYEYDKSLVENLFNLAYINQQVNNPIQTINYLEKFVEESKNRNDLKQLRDEAIKQLGLMKKQKD